MLKRGEYELPHQAQMIKRDLHGEQISRAFGGKAFAYRLSAEQLQDRKDGKPGTGLPYEYLVYAPNHPEFSWTAFYTWQELEVFVAAYDLQVSRKPEAGESFTISLPASDEGWQELHDDGKAYRWAS